VIKRTFKDIRNYIGYSFEAAKCELKSEVAGSYLNWLWWIINPFCFMLIYTFVFGFVFSAAEPFFPIFIFIGISIWDFFRITITNSVKIVKKNSMVISRVYMPKYMLLVVQLFVNLFKMMISFGIVILMMIVFAVPITANVLFFFPILIVLFLNTFGLACFVMHFGVFVADMANVVTLGLRMMMYVTGIFYNIEKRIPVFGEILNKYNPVAFLISSMRDCLIYSTTPDLIGLLIWLGIGLLLSYLGIKTVYAAENGYVKVI